MRLGCRRARSEPEPPRYAQLTEQQILDLKLIFKHCDSNRNGSLERAELEKVRCDVL